MCLPHACVCVCVCRGRVENVNKNRTMNAECWWNLYVVCSGTRMVNTDLIDQVILWRCEKLSLSIYCKKYQTNIHADLPAISTTGIRLFVHNKKPEFNSVQSNQYFDWFWFVSAYFSVVGTAKVRLLGLYHVTYGSSLCWMIKKICHFYFQSNDETSIVYVFKRCTTDETTVIVTVFFPCKS